MIAQEKRRLKLHDLWLTVPFLMILFGGYMAYRCGEFEKDYYAKKIYRGMREITFHDHEYVIWEVGYSHCMTHSPNCKCNKTGEKI